MKPVLDDACAHETVRPHGCIAESYIICGRHRDNVVHTSPAAVGYHDYEPPKRAEAICEVTDEMARKGWVAFAETWAVIADPSSEYYRGTKSGYELAVRGMKAALEAALNG